MSYSTTTHHRPQVHVPWTPVLAALITALLVVVALYVMHHSAITPLVAM